MNEKRATIPHSWFRALAEGREYVGFAIQAKSCRRDSDDGVRFPLEGKLLLDRLWTSAETTLPQTVTDDRDGCCAGLVFLRQEGATCDEGDA